MNIPLIPQLNKQQLILRDIVCQHMEEYRGKQDELVQNWRHYNVENLVEEAMCRVGGYEFVNAHHYDNSDYSDTKTATVARAVSKTTGNHSYKISIGGVVSAAGTPKAGDLRVVIYNPCYDRLDYWFMPKAEWEHIREWGQANGDKLRANYSPELDYVYKWDSSWRCASFEELAQRPATITSPNIYTPKLKSQFDNLFCFEDDADDWVIEHDQDLEALLDREMQD